MATEDTTTTMKGGGMNALATSELYLSARKLDSLACYITWQVNRADPSDPPNQMLPDAISQLSAVVAELAELVRRPS